jgi:hypothetical protein
MNPKELYFSLPKKSRDVLNTYHLKGLILKQVSEDILPQLDGVVSGVVGETHKDNSVTISTLINDADGSSVKPFLKWTEGEVTVIKSAGRRTKVTYVIPEGRSQGVFIDRNNRVYLPLRS